MLKVLHLVTNVQCRKQSRLQIGFRNGMECKQRCGGTGAGQERDKRKKPSRTGISPIRMQQLGVNINLTNIVKFDITDVIKNGQ